MEKLKSPVPSPFKGKDITVLAGKFKHMALNTPLRFSVQALRPHSKNTARFGSLSHHSFFSRHNPHPQRVTHIQGSLSDAWREELRELAARVTAVSFAKKEKKETVSRRARGSVLEGHEAALLLNTEKSQRETQYSEETGRLIPPPSRAITRHSSRCTHKNNAKNKSKDATMIFQDQELIILELLCQILQTDSLAAIQQWLLTAGQRDKDLVMGFLQIATANLHLESQELATNMEVRLPAHLSPNASDFTSRLHSFGRNHSNRVFVATQKQECIPEEEKPVLIGTAEILQLHSDTNEKQNQPARTN
ncbi:protein TBATA isoform X4 [Sceloporus undulatus]|uniref:protein TBATA isoform X4 n=1 Tax=Sceloporus undulatus TaxID=8520 RepID=UPI001C4C1E2D|nr:protein TBATA isoform X4 [Sceloporus undulatus]